MIKLLLVFLVLLSPLAFSKEQYFQLYSRGKILESIQSLEKELQQYRYNPLTLNTQFQILTSAYFSHLAVSDELTLRVLKAINSQLNSSRARQGIDQDVHLFTRELEAILHQRLSLNATRSLLSSVINQSNQRRSVQLQVLAIISHRKALQAESANEKAAWLFISGKAGFYRYNSGNNELATYIKVCEQLKNAPACSNLSEAREMYELGEKVLRR